MITPVELGMAVLVVLVRKMEKTISITLNAKQYGVMVIVLTSFKAIAGNIIPKDNYSYLGEVADSIIDQIPNDYFDSEDYFDSTGA